MEKKNLDGERFNRWTVIGEGDSIIRFKKNGKPNPIRVLKCQCDCGTIKEVRQGNLVNGSSKSCGCHHKEICRGLMKELHKTQKGSGNPNWKGGIAYHNKKEKSEIRTSFPYKEWAKSVKLRDGYHCKICNSNKQAQAHHLINFSNNIESRFDINNGITMCRICHNKFHKEYGRYDNTPEQFIEFKKYNYVTSEMNTTLRS